MRSSGPLSPLQRTALAVQGLLDSFDGEGAIIGGVAVALYYDARSTVDVDAFVLGKGRTFEQILQTAKDHGFLPRREDALEFSKSKFVFLLIYPETGVEVDLIVALTGLEADIAKRAVRVDVGDGQLVVPTVEDLILMKLIAQRASDLADVEALLQTNPHVDRKRILKQVREFAELTDQADMAETAERLLKEEQ